MLSVGCLMVTTTNFLDKYTHIVIVHQFYIITLECDKGDNITKTIINLARENNVTVLMERSLPENIRMEWANYPSIRYNYLTSLPNAMKECNIDS